MKRIKVLTYFSLIFSVLLLSACSSNSNSNTDVLTKIKEKGVLTIGTSADYAPYEFHVLEDGVDKIVGFEMDIAGEIAKELGVDLEIIDMSFEGLLTDLNSSKVDMVVSGMSPTPEREEVVDFSDVYYYAKQVMLIRENDSANYTSIKDFAGKKIGFQRNSLQENIFNEHFTQSTPVSLTKIPNIILELKNGSIDACIVEYPVALGYVEQYPEITFTNFDLPVEEDAGAAIAIKKGNEELLNFTNQVINRLIQEDSINKLVSDAILIAEY